MESFNRKGQHQKRTLTKVIQFLLIVFAYVLIGVSVYFIFKHLGLTLNDVRNYLSSIGVWAFILFVFLQVFTNVILFVIPGQTLQFIALGLTLFSPLVTFFLVLIGVVLASLINFLIGRLLGEKFVKRIIGEETYDKYQNKLRTKAYIYYPLMMLLPFFPDDEITILAGLTKMNIGFFVFSTLLTRAVGVAFFTFVPGQISYAYKDTFELILLILAAIYVLTVFIYVIRELDKFLTKIIERRG